MIYTWSIFLFAWIFTIAQSQDSFVTNSQEECAVNTRFGLLSDLLGQNPTGRTKCHCCCLSSGQRCPDEPSVTNPRSAVDSGDAPDAVVTRIVNSPPSNPLVLASGNVCPADRILCCYASLDYISSLGDSCSPTTNNWQQFCPENVPSASVGSTGIVGGDSAGPKQCGERSFSPVQQRQGQSSPEEFPWTCLILDGRNNEFVGSCAIIPEKSDNDISRGTRKVITAAHKVTNADLSHLKVRVLEYDAAAFKAPEREMHQEFRVAKVTLHPDYQPPSFRFTNDIAVLTLTSTIDLRSHNGINAACIPNCPQMFGHRFSNGTGTRCWVAGWGKDKADGKFRTIQHKVDVPLYEDRLCEQALRKALAKENKPSLASTLRLDESEICAGGEAGKDACDGDGGAPLVCQALSGRWYVVGLVTWGVSCAQPDVPGVYARVSHFKDWIDSTF